ncbi:pentapeptide repeat-containing protein [Campylobacter sp. RM9929]|uniref:pentapeptide repeat-containing protein n=1 Tax=Campylobacter molothri TaxID=1032242 RepID=UPI001DC97AB5|nr:pentapeptide repeat-containing protein [Campylobacter sp. RM10537]MBZ7947740.1 pentapeptide repeat-containing protein [Campylobacter sp. RM9929]ULO00463.1 putative membrane protein [Campylobacter sp. RM10537]
MEELTKEQAIIDIAENLGISKEYVNFDENKEIYTIKDNNNLKKIHIKKFNCKLYEQYNLSFKKCVFECEIKDTRGLSLNIGNKIFFLKCDFENKIIFFNLYFKNISFILCNFKNETTFQACTFKTFCNFESSVFEHFISFDQSTFLDKVSFYNTYFYKLPNFSRVTFKGDLIATNINLNFDFDELESKIRKGDINFIEYRIKQDEKPLDKFANDFRDSFRVFKNALIKDNNLLDASNFHKYELYCKEIELKQSWNKLKNVTTDEDIKQNNRNYSQLVDFLLLGFYRKLCDHHTDLLRVFNNLILLISLYVLYNFFILYISGKEIINDTKIYLSDIFHNNIFWYIPGILLFICVCSIYFCKNKEKTHVINREIKIKKFQWCKIIIKEILNFLFVCMICYMGISIFGIVGDFLAKFFGLKIFKDVVYISFACLSFFGLFLFFINSLVLRYIFISFSYFVVAFVLFLKPKEFYFIYNIFKDDDKNLAIMSSLNVVYFTLIILVLFSLQKTARKNSIVPS